MNSADIMNAPTIACSVSCGKVNAFNSPTINPAISAPIAFVLLDAFIDLAHIPFFMQLNSMYMSNAKNVITSPNI